MTDSKSHDRIDPVESADDVSRLLDQLGASDRDAPSTQFEDRIAAATFSIVTESPAPLAIIRPGRTSWLTPLRIAACLGLMSSVGLALIASQRTTESPGSQLAVDTERQVEAILSLSSAFDDDIQDELPLLADQASGLSERVRQGLGASDWLNEGAM